MYVHYNPIYFIELWKESGNECEFSKFPLFVKLVRIILSKYWQLDAEKNKIVKKIVKNRIKYFLLQKLRFCEKDT